MIVIVSVCAAAYASAIAIFRTPPPLSTRFIGQLLPMVFSLLFGPAGAWGIAIGDSVSGLITGEMSVGLVFGFCGNFLLGLLPYTLCRNLVPMSNLRGDVPRTFRGVSLYFLVAVGSASAASIVIALPLEWLGLVPFRLILPLIGVQDAVAGCISIVLLQLLYQRVESLDLLWWQVMDLQPGAPRASAVAGAWIVLLASTVCWVVAMISCGEMAYFALGIGVVSILVGTLMMW